MENMQEEFRDYRYIIDNLSELSVGARYQYQELVDNIDLSYKYRCIIKRFLLQEVDPGTTIEEHFYTMRMDSESYEIYHQLRTRIRCYVRSGKRRLFGSEGYEERMLPIEELAAMSYEDKRAQNMMITEIEIPKMRLMSYAM